MTRHAHEDDTYDLSITASIASNQAAWRHIHELKGLFVAMPEAPAKARAKELLAMLHGWFHAQEDRLEVMQARRDRKRGRK